MKRIIVNGDDYGLNERCSRAIAEALRRGLITDTTMLANGAWFSGALTLAREEGFTDRIGIHFNLTEGEPLTEDICALSDYVRDGRFHKGWLCSSRPLSRSEQKAIYHELSAQAERIERAGIRITHADSHHYVHNLVPLAPIVADVCREHGIDRVRLSRRRGTEDIQNISDSWWREQGFLTASHFGYADSFPGSNIPDDTEIIVHPDYDRDGRLIDRKGIGDGCAVGVPLPDLRGEDRALTGYAFLPYPA